MAEELERLILCGKGGALIQRLGQAGRSPTWCTHRLASSTVYTTSNS